MGRGTVRLTLTSVFDDKGMKKAENALRDFDKKMEEMGGASSLAHKMAEVSTKAELMGARMQSAGRAMAGVGDSMTAASPRRSSPSAGTPRTRRCSSKAR